MVLDDKYFALILVSELISPRWGYIGSVIPPVKVNPADVGTGNPRYILLGF